MKQKSKLLLWGLCLFFASCSEEVRDEYHTHETVVPYEGTFVTDSVAMAQLPSVDRREIFRLDEPSAVITDRSRYSFRMNELLQVRSSDSGDSIRITSYSARTLHQVTLELYLPAVDTYLPVAHFDSIPAFSQFQFKPSWIGKRVVYPKEPDRFISFEYAFLDLAVMKPRWKSADVHLRKLQQIQAQWEICFSNFDWKDAQTSSNWLEMRPIFAREWLVIMTNYAYMLTTPEFAHVMQHFREVFGGDLYDNNRVPFTAEQYAQLATVFHRPRVFRLGRTGDQVSGLGGGETLGIAGYNFYGHYASYSGWEAVGHEIMHCMGYSHSSNMTYAVNGVGWTELIWQLHAWLTREKDLPYLDRHLLDFTRPEYAPYRDYIGIREEFLDDVLLEKKMQQFYDRSRLVKYLKEHPLTVKKVAE